MFNFPRSSIACLAALLLTSCVTSGDPLPPTVVDDSFDKISVRFSNSLGTPETVTYYLKIFDQDGMIAVCGTSVLLNKGVIDQLMDRWLDEASVALNSRSNTIVSARFIGQVEAGQKTKPANCVKTATPATPDSLSARARLVGNTVYYQ